VPLPLRQKIKDQRLLALADKVEIGERLSFEDGLLLYETPDLTGVGALANRAREKLHGKKAYYARGRRLSYTNICESKCHFCAFHTDQDSTRAYLLGVEEAISQLNGFPKSCIGELHIVGGLNADLKIDYFESLFGVIKGCFPSVHLKALTMVEIEFYAKNSGLHIEEFLRRCVKAGLDSCPGGGAEIFDEGLRMLICPSKCGARAWLDTARACHGMGLPTNCSMLYGHVEEPRHKVDHLLRLREAQRESLGAGLKGFHAYVPLAYQAEENELAAKYNIQGSTGTQDLREIAVARLLLDNVPHIKAYWVMIGPGLAQVALSYGADDLDGTAEDEEIAHSAGAKTPSGLTIGYLRRIISEAGFEPVEKPYSRPSESPARESVGRYPRAASD